VVAQLLVALLVAPFPYLQTAHQTGNNTQYSALCTTRYVTFGGLVSDKFAVGSGVTGVVEESNMPCKGLDSSVNERKIVFHTRVVDEIFRWEIVATVQDYVPIAVDNGIYVLFAELLIKRDYVDERVEAGY